MSHKVLVDTNVIISAAIRFNVTELHLQVQHRFYDRSTRLLDLFKQPKHRGTGLVTATIRDESFGVLFRAVLGELGDESRDVNVRKSLLDHATALVDTCQINMQKYLAILSVEECDEDAVQVNLTLVEDLCTYLTRVGWNYRDPIWIREQAEKTLPPSPRRFRFPDPIRSAATYAYREQLRRERTQFERYLIHGPGSVDKRILAEAIFLFSKFRALDNSTMFHIASCDTGFFSPVRLKGGYVSRGVTAEISRRYGINCDWPYAIAAIIEPEQK